MRDTALHSEVFPCTHTGWRTMRPLVIGEPPPHETGFEELRKKRTYSEEAAPGETDVHLLREPVSPASGQVCCQPLPFDLPAEQKELLDANARKVRNYGEQPRKANVL